MMPPQVQGQLSPDHNHAHVRRHTHTQGAVRNLLRAFRSACHYGDAEALDSAFNIGSSHVFNKVMVFVLREADGLFRTLLGVQGRTADAVVQTQTLIKVRSLCPPGLGPVLGAMPHPLRKIITCGWHASSLLST
jgi:hypothetical protein